MSDDRLWLQKVVASERKPVAFQLKDGSWMQISTHPIHGGGRVYLRTDITKLKRIEESLRENELQFRTLVENNPLPLWLTDRSEEHTSELQSLMRISYAVFCLKKKKKTKVNS